jgi:hypothetical protein
MAGTDHECGAASICVPVPAEDIRDSVSDPIPEHGFAISSQTVRAEGVGAGPCAGGIDDCPGKIPPPAALGRD